MTLRSIPVSEITDAHHGHFVRFQRATTELGGRRLIKGQLIRVDRIASTRGNMPSTDFYVIVAHPDRWGGYTNESHGPIPGRFPITVGHLWKHRKTDYELDLEREQDEMMRGYELESKLQALRDKYKR